MGALGLCRAPDLARSWILGWVRSSEEGMKTGDAVFMPRGVFAAGGCLTGVGVRTELCVELCVIPSVFSCWSLPSSRTGDTVWVSAGGQDWQRRWGQAGVVRARSRGFLEGRASGALECFVLLA